MASSFLAAGTAVPPYRVTNEEIVGHLASIWPRLRRLEQDEATAAGGRYLSRPLPELVEPRDLTQRMQDYAATARELGGRAAQEALTAGATAPEEIDLVISVSCTGFMIPSLDAFLVGDLGLRPNVVRVPLTELGCSGGAAAIGFAHRHLQANPTDRVLIVAVELSSLTFQRGDLSLDNLTAALVFGDGAAAVVMGGPEAGRLRVEGTASELVPGSQGMLGFDLREGGFHVVLDRRLPRFIEGALRDLVDRFRCSQRMQRVDYVVAHGGGPRIMDAVATALELDPAALAGSRSVLERVGNLSSASIFFALQDEIARPRRGSTGLGLAFGPGVTVELLHLAA